MKAFLGTFILFVSCIAANSQAGQSPLAPPKIPPSSSSGTSLRLGAKAPDFALPNGDGKMVVLSEYTQRSPVVLIFYRGFWCGACTQQLSKLAEDYVKFRQAGGELIAISVDEQSYAWSMGQTTGARFQILSDA